LVSEKTAALGAKVVASDINATSVGETVDSIRNAGGEAIAVAADVTDLGQMRGLADRAVEAFGAIDVMVNNAGVMPLAFYADHGVAGDAWAACIDINIKGVLFGTMAVHDQMIAQGRGHVINLSSIYGNQPVAGAAVYGASKAAVNFLSDALRQESQGKIKVTTIRPTGVPGTALGDGVINPMALAGILGTGMEDFMQKVGAMASGDAPDGLSSPDNIEYFALDADLLADQIVYAIDQPWGVSISDLTVRASGDSYVI
jgi:NADP-dependent 3-hydroxy acid dehydrogenase YdfG